MQRSMFIVRVMPAILVAMGVLHLADWIYVGFSDQLKLVNGVGFLLMGTAYFAATRLSSTGANSPARKALLALGVLGFALTAWVLVQQWL